MNARFLNVDLILESNEPLALIERHLGSSVFALHSGPIEDGHLLSLEIEGFASDADETIHALCEAVEVLPEEAKTLWNRCRRRLFDVGFDASDDSHLLLHTSLRNETLKRVVALGGEIAFNVYRPNKNDAP